jgi:hypothetical protein
MTGPTRHQDWSVRRPEELATNSAPDHSARAELTLRPGLFFSTTGKKAGVTVTGVAGVPSLRGEKITDVLWNLAPGLSPTRLEVRVILGEENLRILP